MPASQINDIQLESLDIDNFPDKPDELTCIAKTLQQLLHERTRENKKLQSQMTVLKAQYHAGLDTGKELPNLHGKPDGADATVRLGGMRWLRAEHDYPIDSSSSYSCFSSEKLPEVIMFNSSTKELTVESIAILDGQEAVFSRLPSRLCKTVFLWVDKTDHPHGSTARYRITSSKHSGGGLMQRKVIHLSHLSTSAQAKVLLGKIKWIFILKPSRTQST